MPKYMLAPPLLNARASCYIFYDLTLSLLREKMTFTRNKNIIHSIGDK
eukprot:UN21438